MGLVDMVKRVNEIMKKRGEIILEAQYVNRNRNYVMKTNKGAYLLKWDSEPFYAAKQRAGVRGVGMTVDPNGAYYPFMNHFVGQDRTVLFQWIDSGNNIYSKDTEQFAQLAKDYTQKGGESVMVIAIADLERWE